METAGEATGSVALGMATPASTFKIEINLARTIGVDGIERIGIRDTVVASRHTVGQRFGKGAHDSVNDTVADSHAVGHGSGKVSIDDASFWRQDGDGPIAPGVGRHFTPNRHQGTTDNCRTSHVQGAVDRSFSLRIGARKVDLNAITLDTQPRVHAKLAVELNAVIVDKILELVNAIGNFAKY